MGEPKTVVTPQGEVRTGQVWRERLSPLDGQRMVEVIDPWVQAGRYVRIRTIARLVLCERPAPTRRRPVTMVLAKDFYRRFEFVAESKS